MAEKIKEFEVCVCETIDTLIQSATTTTDALIHLRRFDALKKRSSFEKHFKSFLRRIFSKYRMEIGSLVNTYETKKVSIASYFLK